MWRFPAHSNGWKFSFKHSSFGGRVICGYIWWSRSLIEKILKLCSSILFLEFSSWTIQVRFLGAIIKMNIIKVVTFYSHSERRIVWCCRDVIYPETNPAQFSTDVFSDWRASYPQLKMSKLMVLSDTMYTSLPQRNWWPGMGTGIKRLRSSIGVHIFITCFEWLISMEIQVFIHPKSRCSVLNGLANVRDTFFGCSMLLFVWSAFKHFLLLCQWW